MIFSNKRIISIMTRFTSTISLLSIKINTKVLPFMFIFQKKKQRELFNIQDIYFSKFDQRISIIKNK